MEVPELLPVLPVRQAVLFPNAAVPLVVSRPRAVQAVRKAQQTGGQLIVVTQREPSEAATTSYKDLKHREDLSEESGALDLYALGVVCRISKVNFFEDGSCQLIATGMTRYQIKHYLETSGYLTGQGRALVDKPPADGVLASKLSEQVKELACWVLRATSVPGAEDLQKLITQLNEPGQIADLCATFLTASVAKKQELLELLEVDRRLTLLFDLLQKEKVRLSLQSEVNSKVHLRVSREQREQHLREQLRVIREELGEEATPHAYETRIRDAGLPGNASKALLEEAKRLQHVHRSSPEYQVIRSYLDLALTLPWKNGSASPQDLDTARQILDSEHYGMERVKRRIVQFLAVEKLKPDLRGPILCLVGPPGVGKTTLGQSIAKALGREFSRVSLGGVRDEAEIRGHRRTYIGAMPGKILQTLKRTQVNDPVILLDEIDKMGTDFRGDPSSALLEVLDPEQNRSFLDHYLDIPFDLGKVFFIATANNLEALPYALRDRLEVIEMTGYSKWEKRHIANQHLFPSLLEEHGLTAEQVTLPESTLSEVIDSYTCEAGVRSLNRELAALLRAAAEDRVRTHTAGKSVLTVDRLTEILGPRRYFPWGQQTSEHPGFVTGLAWTQAGGEVLQIEALRFPGTGQLILTGKLGEVMKESAQIAFSLLRSRVTPATLQLLSTCNFHLHLPSGAVPKEGPSAGVALYLALRSQVESRRVPATIGFSGEITLQGRILPVGGIKEKILAAHRSGLESVCLPKANETELEEVPEEVRKTLRFHFVRWVEELDRLLSWQEPKSEQLEPAPPPTLSNPSEQQEWTLF